jgi:RND family efflux transporter MFP subunit
MKMEAERRRLKEDIRESEVRLNLAKIEFDRAQRLYEGKAISLRQLQAAEADYKAAQANVAGATEQLKALSEEGETSTYEVRAPISGVIASVNKAMGEQVSPGESILEIVNLNTVWIETPIFEQDLARLRLQESAIFTTAAFPNTEFQGTLINLGAVIDEKTRAATVLFEVSNPGRRLRIGMQANVRMDAEESVNAVLIPKEAVLDNEGTKIVYVLLSGETFQRRQVELGDEYGEDVAVLSGIMPGQRVVTQGAYQLKLQELKPADAGAHTHEM